MLDFTLWITKIGPAPDGVTNAIYANTMKLQSYKTCPDLQCNIDTIGTSQFTVNGNTFVVDVIDSVNDYAILMKEIFDFTAIKNLFSCPNPLKMLINCMHGGEKCFLKETVNLNCLLWQYNVMSF